MYLTPLYLLFTVGVFVLRGSGTTSLLSSAKRPQTCAQKGDRVCFCWSYWFLIIHWLWWFLFELLKDAFVPPLFFLGSLIHCMSPCCHSLWKKNACIWIGVWKEITQAKAQQWIKVVICLIFISILSFWNHFFPKCFSLDPFHSTHPCQNLSINTLQIVKVFLQ